MSDKQSEAQKQERGGGEERAVHTHTRKDINIKTCTNVRHFLYLMNLLHLSRITQTKFRDTQIILKSHFVLVVGAVGMRRE